MTFIRYGAFPGVRALLRSRWVGERVGRLRTRARGGASLRLPVVFSAQALRRLDSRHEVDTKIRLSAHKKDTNDYNDG